MRSINSSPRSAPSHTAPALSTRSASSIPRNSPRSIPAENAESTPVKINARTRGSASARVIAAISASIIAVLSALRCVGLLSVIIAAGYRASYKTIWSAIFFSLPLEVNSQLMCGRFTITRRDGNALAAELGVASDSFVDYRPRYNVAPTQMHYVVRIKFENREVLPARWGLVNSWADNAANASRNINARSETVDNRRAFREAFFERR